MIRLSFPGTSFPPLEVEPETPLPTCLSSANSPVLFGCRTGLCGTCAVRVRGGDAPAPDIDELEVLEIDADGIPDARLACQLKLRSDAELRRLR